MGVGGASLPPCSAPEAVSMHGPSLAELRWSRTGRTRSPARAEGVGDSWGHCSIPLWHCWGRCHSSGIPQRLVRTPDTQAAAFIAHFCPSQKGRESPPPPPQLLPQLPVSQGGLKFVLFAICINKPFELIKKKKQTQSHKCLKSNWGCQTPSNVGGHNPGPPSWSWERGGYCLSSTWFWSRAGASREGAQAGS